MKEPIAWQEQFRLMCEAYRQGIPERLHAIDAAWRTFQSGGWQSQHLQEFLANLHNLTGSGATFGFKSLSRASHQLECLLEKEFVVSGHRPGPDDLRRYHHYLDSIRQIGRHLPELQTEAPPLAPSPQPDAATRNTSSQSSEGQPATPEVLYIVKPNLAQAESLAQQLGHLGFRARPFQTLEAALEQVEQDQPVAIVLDTRLLTDAPQGHVQLMEIRRRHRYGLRLLFISDQTDIPTRLMAVKAGGEGFFVRPLQISNLANKLDQCLSHSTPEPYRVVIVEDDPVMAEYCAIILERHGIRAVIAPDPMQLNSLLAEVRADVILMDRYLGDSFDGLELAEVIRQDDACLSIPIVFISTESDEMRRLDAIQQGGGDDFLTKPVAPRLLIQTVVTRARRHRALSSLMLRDSLTGLLPHSRFHEQLPLELARAQRAGTKLSLAILDIDYFKRVNDTYGHATGDQVLRSLSRLLIQRLRKTDVVGRLGGEEFAVILPETGLENARGVLDQLRRDFSQLRHQSEHGAFQVTFSAGIATSTPGIPAGALADQADKALYAAKRAGRDRVMVAPESVETLGIAPP